MKKKKYYLHRVDGRPGGFDGDQICYGWHRMLLVSSLKQIRKEQRASRAYRMRCNFDIAADYDYLLVYLPNPERRKA